jgi:hypothetical protein
MAVSEKLQKTTRWRSAGGGPKFETALCAAAIIPGTSSMTIFAALHVAISTLEPYHALATRQGRPRIDVVLIAWRAEVGRADQELAHLAERQTERFVWDERQTG